MTSPRILLVGYYGRGNFGDDILLKVTHGLLKTVFPDAQFSIIVDAEDGDYVRRLLSDDIQILRPARHGHFDYIIHGGGGVFFDFQQYGFVAKCIENIVTLIGFKHYVVCEKWLRRALGKPRTSATHRVGFGIGVGEFSAGSQKLLRQSLPVLSDFAALWLRDENSMQNLRRFESVMQAKLLLGSDLAFLTDYWLGTIPEKLPSTRQNLGIILRDRADNNMPMLQNIIADLAQEYDITGFILEQHQDPKMITLLAPYATHIWQPQSQSIDDFMKHLAQQDVLLASRAHGAICGACVGVPSVIVDIEPKLTQVHDMLSDSSILVPAQDTSSWQKALQDAQAIPKETILADVQKSRQISEAAWKEMQQWIL